MASSNNNNNINILNLAFYDISFHILFIHSNRENVIHIYIYVYIYRYICGCSVTKSCPTICDLTNCNTPGLPLLHYLPEFAQTHVHWVAEAMQPSHPLLPPSLPAFPLSEHQGLFQWVGSLHQVAKVLELQLQHQCFQWIFRVNFL